MKEELRTKLIEEEIKKYNPIPLGDDPECLPCFKRKPEELEIINDYLLKCKNDYGDIIYVFRTNERELGLIRGCLVDIYSYICDPARSKLHDCLDSIRIQISVDNLIEKLDKLDDMEYSNFFKEDPYYKLCIIDRIPVWEIVNKAHRRLDEIIEMKEIKKAEVELPIAKIKLKDIQEKIEQLQSEERILLCKIKYMNSLLPKPMLEINDIDD